LNSPKALSSKSLPLLERPNKTAIYEIRQELVRANKTKGISRLDDLTELIEYFPITTPAMRQAVKLWAQARHSRATDGRQ
jgi:ABC-type molybdate transport system permease subunit